MKELALGLALMLGSVSGLAIGASPALAQDMSNGADNFYRSDRVVVEKITFENKFGMKVVGNLFTPQGLDRSAQTPAIVVGHPMGATKEQSANLYATKLAEQGFVTLSFDLSFWGESEGQPRNTVAPEIYADDFSAAVDFLSTQPFVNKDNIGVLGICGSGSFALSAAQIDPRMKAIATVSMYDMGAANRDGLRKGVSVEQRKEMLKVAAQQRLAEYQGAEIKLTGGTVDELKADSNAIEREFYDFYRTPRGEFTPKGQTPLQTTHPTLSSNAAFMNFYPFAQIETISPRPLLFIAGEQAHSIEFSENAYERASEPKELVIIPGAGHVDLYDRVNLIPFDKLTAFFRGNLSS
ncbi:alpha/beta hydrolase [Phyllobacterium zundukense]|jgi:uncharacterized protein|uniref:Dienelactone hydrolase domain-containing protein n=1 Tax=Phyllobacterium zundukense TaxID=1867719 RepID=A0A2N9VQK0_9HYPH|nr:alpha/beta hydrolase [Phyllobacterium zundukense]ATU94243.1 hypothetical protein BLM14_20990 [Phyllobacterium zundukense]PIO41768.1 hypothetical protein B5P45_26945 [Phyllobacterium zundukense]